MKNNFIVICLVLSSFLYGSCSNETLTSPSYLELSQDTLLFSCEASSEEVDVHASSAWSAEIENKQNTWCAVSKVENGMNVSVGEHLGKELRYSDIKVEMGSTFAKVHIMQLGTEPEMLVSPTRCNLYYDETSFEIQLVTNQVYEVNIPDSISWIRLSKAKSENIKILRFEVDTNATKETRFTSIRFVSEDKELERSVMVVQKSRDTAYEPGDTEGLGDIKIEVDRSEASSAQAGEGIELSLDGDLTTHYHSPWGGTNFPIELTYYFPSPQSVDYIVYKPRTVGGENGAVGDMTLWVKYKGHKFKKIDDYQLDFNLSPSTIAFENTQKEVEGYRFVITSGKNSFVSCAEMEFYEKRTLSSDLLMIFTDELYSELKDNVTQAQINGIESDFFRSLAQSIYDKTYNHSYRIQEYEAIPTIETTARVLKTSGYNPFENPTGIYFNEGEEVIVFVKDIPSGERISLKIQNFDAPYTTDIHALRNGLNKIIVGTTGLGYISYHTDNHSNLSPLKIHIASGRINGYFDKNKHSREEWKNLLSSANYGFFDIIGDRINLVYTVPELKKYCSDGRELIDKYDKIVEIEHDIMGLEKYNLIPKNKMFARTVESGLFADGWGAGLARDCMWELADPEQVIKGGTWAVAHELGHVNQIRPGLKWVSTTEVTNNIFSAIVRYYFTPEYMNLEHERVNDGDNNHVLGGRMNSYLNYGIVKGEQWLCQRGQDRMENYENGGDHFVKLCPLWQLMLYYRLAKDASWHHPDWFGEVAQIVRNTDESQMSDGQLQLNFMKNVCDVIGEDLTDFFYKCGMLKPIDKFMDDYSPAQLTITQQQCDELRDYAAKYPKPTSPVIYYLSVNSLQAYNNQLDVEGGFNEGIEKNGEVCQVSHDVWRNVAVFETYENDELIKVAMVGTDSKDLSSTLVRYPMGATRIEAVSWDGQRTLVYGQR